MSKYVYKKKIRSYNLGKPIKVPKRNDFQWYPFPLKYIILSNN